MLTAVTMYKTEDGEMFYDKEEAEVHKIKLAKVKVYAVYSYPENSIAAKRVPYLSGYILVNADLHHSLFATWYMHENFGNCVFFNDDSFRSSDISLRWKIEETDFSNLDQNKIIAKLEDCNCDRLWGDSYNPQKPLRIL